MAVSTGNDTKTTSPLRGAPWWGGLLMGLGGTAVLTHIIFTQWLEWHSVFDRAGDIDALVSNAIVLGISMIFIFPGALMLADARGRRTMRAGVAWSGFLIGAGVYLLLDGLIFQQLLGWHDIRYGVELLPYQLAWNGIGAGAVLTGVLLTWSASRSRR